MPRSAGVSVENNFTRGLITEVTGVNSPENSVLSSLDVVYDRKGRASSRQSFKNEDGFANVDVSTGVTSGTVRNEFLWDTVSGIGSKSFVVCQIGSRIYFFDPTSGSLSSGFQAFSVNLLSFKIASFSDLDISSNQASFSYGKGYLFVAHPMCEPFYIKYNSLTNTITTTVINIKIRDLEGVNDGLAVDLRPGTLSVAHRYNLLNQGWYADARINSDTPVANTLAYWDSVRSDFPSNVDVWWYFLRVSQSSGDEILQGLANTADSKKGLYGNSPAPKGHYLINPFETNRSALSGVAGVPETSSNGYRPSVISFYAGRVFYAGVGADNYSSTIYFSQIVERDEQLGQCYQSADPTSREIFDLVDSDGGTLKIQDIAKIIDIRVVGQSLIVFATNGVWSISGSDNGPFRATDYTVNKITSFPAISKSSIVDVGGTPVWWNYEAIYTLKSSELGLTNDVTNMTDTTIKTFYEEEIPSASKLYSKGMFNEQLGLVYWIYKSTNDDGLYEYDRILVLDTVSGAFYPLSIPQDGFVTSGIVSVRGVSPIIELDQVTTSGLVGLTTSGGDPVTTRITTGYNAGSKVFKFLKFTGGLLTFSEVTGTDSLDFGTIPYTPDFISGHRVRGELIKNFQTNYLTVLTEDVENGSCYVQGLWDYSNSPDSGRYSNPQQVYRSRTFRDYQQSKIKIRGNGRSVRFHFFGEAGRPFTIIGWAGFETADTVV